MPCALRCMCAYPCHLELTACIRHCLQLPDDRAADLLSAATAHPLDVLAIRKYKGLVEQYGFAGGIYVQVSMIK